MNLTRRNFLKKTIGVAVSLLPFSSIACAKSSSLHAGPKDTKDMNILMVCVEDWSAFTIGCYGNKVVQTPHVDSLAKKGVLFNRAYCQSAVCNPSRASFCTGLRPDSTRVYGNDDTMDQVAPEGAPFISDLLSKKKDAYLVTMGKLVHKWSEAKRFISGFDEVIYTHHYDKPGEKYRGVACEAIHASANTQDTEDHFNYLKDAALQVRLKRLRKERDDKIAAGHPDNWEVRKPFQSLVAEQVGDSGLPEEQMEDGRLARHAAQLLERFAKENRQFFLNVGLYSTHTPLLAPKKFVDMYDPDEMELTPALAEKDKNVPPVAKRFGRNYDIFNGLYPEYGPTEKRQKEAIAAYYACSSYVDSQIGVILGALKQNGLEDNTIVVFFSDHGFHLGEHGCWSKFTLFEQSTKVPMIVYVPGAKGNGKVCDEIVELVDILPTLCDFWDIQKPSVFESISFEQLLENPSQSWKKAAYSMIPIGGLGRSVRTKRYKYAEWRKSKAIPAAGEQPYARELYDLQSDPFEQHNIVDDVMYKEVVDEHESLLRQGWAVGQRSVPAF